MGVAPVAPDVVGAVDVHEQRDQGDDEQHHHGGSVEEHPHAEVDVAVRPPGPRLVHRLDGELDMLLFGCDRGADRGLAVGQAVLLLARPCASLLGVVALLGGVLGVVDALAPLHVGDDGQHEAGTQRRDADLGTLLRHPLPEEEDEEERGRRDERDDPRLVEQGGQPFISAMSSRSTLRRLR